jgi:hypothetical protein
MRPHQLTIRAWMIALGAAVVAVVLVALVSAWASHESNPPVPTGPHGEAVVDTYTFVHQTLAGDGTVTARVTSLSGAQPHTGLPAWAKAGIILEPDTSQGTAYTAVMVTGSRGVRMQDNYTHDTPGLSGTVGPSSPRWLRLNRTGDAITGYDSTNGAHWTRIGTTRLTGLPHTVQIGLFVTSPPYFAAGAAGGTPSLATATFDQLTTRGDLPQRSWTADAIGDSYPYPPSTSAGQQPSADAFTISGSGDIAPLVGGEGAATHWAGASIVNGTVVALLIVIVFAALYAAGPRRSGGVPAAGPCRDRVLAARATVAGSLAFTAGTVATAIAEAVTRHILAANGNHLFPQDGPVLARVITGTGLLMGLAAVLVVSLGAILVHRASTIAAGIVLLILPGILGTATPLATRLGDWLMRYTPTAAFAIQATLPRSNLVTGPYIPANGYFPISSWAGLAVLAAYTAAALVTARWLLRRPDA